VTLKQETIEDPYLFAILNKLFEQGLQKYRVPFIRRRLEHRMRLRKIPNYQKYAELLSKDPNEFTELISSFSITVTEFFRDPSFFERLRINILPSIIDNCRLTGSQTPEIKIWCAGSATGEEPYSIAILVRELLNADQNAMNLSSCRLGIFATDINSSSIGISQEGIYEETSLKNVTQNLLSRYFQRVSPKVPHSSTARFYQVSEDIRKSVDFHVADLTKTEPPATDFDMILCRNVMIYFDRESREKLIDKFHKALKPHGYLAIGQSEVLMGKLLGKFRSIYLRERIYQKA